MGKNWEERGKSVVRAEKRKGREEGRRKGGREGGREEGQKDIRLSTFVCWGRACHSSVHNRNKDLSLTQSKQDFSKGSSDWSPSSDSVTDSPLKLFCSRYLTTNTCL